MLQFLLVTLINSFYSCTSKRCESSVIDNFKYHVYLDNYISIHSALDQVNKDYVTLTVFPIKDGRPVRNEAKMVNLFDLEFIPNKIQYDGDTLTIRFNTLFAEQHVSSDEILLITGYKSIGTTIINFISEDALFSIPNDVSYDEFQHDRSILEMQFIADLLLNRNKHNAKWLLNYLGTEEDWKI